MSERKAITTTDLAVLLAISFGGVFAIRWLVRNPDNARQIHMRVFLATQKFAHRRADYWRAVADKAGTKYNELRITT